MKTKTKVMLTALALVTLIIACKKNNQQEPSRVGRVTIAEPRASKKGMIPIKQKFYCAPTEVSTRIIKQFKHEIPQSQARLIEDQNIATDSALWVLEAALNFDFDDQHAYDDNYRTLDVTYECNIPVNENAGTFDADDLEELYGDFTTQINGLVNDSIKVKFIDVEGWTNDPGTGIAKVTVQIYYFSINIATNCFFIYPACWYEASYAALGSPSSFFVPCATPPSTLHAGQYLESVINCETPITPCSEDQRSYWTDLGFQQYDGNDNGNGPAYPGTLLYTGFFPDYTLCSMSLASTNNLGTYKSNALTLAQSNVPGYMAISYIDIKPDYGYQWNANYSYFEYTFFWVMDVHIGKWNCKSITE